MYKMLKILCLTLFSSVWIAHAGEPASSGFPGVRAEIKAVHKAEQKAFIEGDCEKVVSYFDEEVHMYTNGRQVPSVKALQAFCNRIPRPFKEEGEISDSYEALSESIAYTVRKIEFPPGSEDAESHKREVVTKIWSRTPSGWKIVHFHSSVNAVPNR